MASSTESNEGEKVANSETAACPAPAAADADDGTEYGTVNEIAKEDEVPQTLSTFTCPICLDEVKVSPNNDAVFILKSCNHKICAGCLKAYCGSKIRDGSVDIPCCHFDVTSLNDSDDFKPCGVIMLESDIDLLLRQDSSNDEGIDKWCDAQVGERRMNLRDRYQQLKFDARHGKECVRRCPSCDHPHLFDVIIMNEYKAKHLSTTPVATNQSAAVLQNNTISESTGYLDRLFGLLRSATRDQRDTGETGRDTNARETLANNSKLPQAQDPPPVEDVETGTVEMGNAEMGNSSNEEMKTEECLECEEMPKSKTPVISCENCSCEFCFFHSNAHQGDCISYHKKSLELDQTNIDYANNVLKVKPCPHCGMAVSKAGGCNQIKCPGCGTNFCWICGVIVDDGAFPEHFRWWNLKGCANLQLDEGNDPKRYTVYMAKALSVAQIIVLGPPSVVLTLISMLLCPCCLPGCGTNMRERFVNCVSFYGSFLSTLIMLPFTLLGFLLLTILYCVATCVLFVMKFVTQGNRRGQIRGTGGDQGSSDRTNSSVRGGGSSSSSCRSSNSAELARETDGIILDMEEGGLKADEVNGCDDIPAPVDINV